MRPIVLIYDDSADLLDVCTILFKMKGYDVYTKTSCDSIIQDIEQINPAIVLIDLWITTMGGAAAIKLMRTNTITNKIPVIIISADGRLQAMFPDSGADDFVVKPFDIHELLAKVNEHLKK